MQKLDPIEAALARLMPPALSQDFQLDLEDMIDGLAGEESEPISKPRPHTRWWIAGGVAAAVAGIAAVVPLMNSPMESFSSIVPASAASNLVLVSESDRIESMTDEGWQETWDGTAMHAVRLNVVEENSLRDEETGIVVQVSEPREEILLMPISAF
jgi:hypothetical protein